MTFRQILFGGAIVVLVVIGLGVLILGGTEPPIQYVEGRPAKAAKAAELPKNPFYNPFYAASPFWVYKILGM